MRAKITNGNGWYSEMKGYEYEIVEDTRSGGLLYFLSEDVVADKSTVRFISPEDCEIIPNVQDSPDIESLRLALTEAALSAARELIEVLEMPCYENSNDILSCDSCDKPLDNHHADCEWGRREQAYEAALSRLAETLRG